MRKDKRAIERDRYTQVALGGDMVCGKWDSVTAGEYSWISRSWMNTSDN